MEGRHEIGTIHAAVFVSGLHVIVCVCVRVWVCVPPVAKDLVVSHVLFCRGTTWSVTVAVQRRGCYRSLV